MVEFTGERVVPGQVSDDLWAEHVARYAFARLHSDGKQVLDAGCGTGYGSAELAGVAAGVTGFDIAPEAIEYAQAKYARPGLRFLVSSGGAMPFPPNAFDLVVAFEVIEHLRDQRSFLQECARVLKHQGLFIVSSPNRLYYADSRAQTGPNPYHSHEFEPQEFVSELGGVFSNVRLLLQNRLESFAFHPEGTGGLTEVRIDRGGKADEAHFLIGLCSFGPLPEPRSFVYVPQAANVLREREQHIQLLEQEIVRARQWLAETQAERDALLELNRQLKDELESRNRWAESLDVEVHAGRKRIVELQDEYEAQQQAALAMAAVYEAQAAALEEESRAKTVWGLETEARLTQELAAKCAELFECVRLLETAEGTVEERTLWAQRAEAQREELAAKLNLVLSLVRSSRWIRLGRKLGLGPSIDQP